MLEAPVVFRSQALWPRENKYRINLGTLSGKTKERLYESDEGGRKVSQLDWKFSNTAFLKGAVNWELFPWLSVGTAGWSILNSWGEGTILSCQTPLTTSSFGLRSVMIWSARSGRTTTAAFVPGTTTVCSVSAWVMSAVRRFSIRGASLQSWVASLFSSSEASFLGRNIAGEDLVLLDDPAADQERARAQAVSGAEGHGYGCWLII